MVALSTHINPAAAHAFVQLWSGVPRSHSYSSVSGGHEGGEGGGEGGGFSGGEEGGGGEGDGGGGGGE